MSRDILIGYASGLQGIIRKLREEKSKLQSENAKLKKSQVIKRSTEFIIFSRKWNGSPTCSEHGAMLCMDEARGMWRCSTCHIGISTHDFLDYLRKEFDGIIVIK